MTEKKNINCSFLGREVFTLTALLVIAVIMICLACWENQEDLEVMDNNPEDILGEDGGVEL